MKVIYVLIVLIFVFLGCSIENSDNLNVDKISDEVISMKITSPDFSDEGIIPKEFTCDGDDISPKLHISDTPKNAKSLVLISDDPDAPIGTWVHWVLWNIPADTKVISKGAKIGISGVTSFGRTGYGGPCPPSGTHRYYFKIYALDKTLDLPSSSKKGDLVAAMDGHIIAQAQLMGRYSRS